MYIDRHSQSVNNNVDSRCEKDIKTKSLFIGWAHLSCIYWHNCLEFVDEAKFEVRQDPKILTLNNKCKYCKMDNDIFKASTCGVRGISYKCTRTFHVRCAIRRGLIVDFETMAEYQ